MTLHRPSPLNTRLRAIDLDRASAQSAWIAALNNRAVAGYRLAAAAVVDSAAVWIALDAGDVGTCHLAPLIASGAVVAPTDPAGRPDVAAAAAALGTLEPIVAAIERIIGHPLRPLAVVDAIPDGAIALRIEASDSDGLVHRLLFAVPDGATIEPAVSLPLHDRAIGAVVPHWSASIAGPAIRPGRLASIGCGDVLLLGTGAHLVRFTPPGRAHTLMARLDLQGGTMMVEQVLDPPEKAATDDGTVSDSAMADIEVRTSVEIAGGGITMQALAALGEGSVVRVPAAAGGVLPVRLHAGGRMVAEGELVAIGDGYGVVVTAVAPRHPRQD